MSANDIRIESNNEIQNGFDNDTILTHGRIKTIFDKKRGERDGR
ncbi:MAG TPA: hypothetical protein VK568_08825 [Thermodesulfobacteriota bacterium]|nr:hypothetical protein [Thermodesulfobacteriota bacterium]